MRNLIDNATKYANSATAALHSGLRFIDISISDNGPGIPADQMELALEPFKRLSKARESNQCGFGFGLVIAKAISEGHDCKLILGSNDPTGLTTTIRLPTLDGGT